MANFFHGTAKGSLTVKHANATVTFYNQGDRIDRASAAASFYSAKLVEYTIREKMIFNARAGKTHRVSSSVKLYQDPGGKKYTASAPGDYPAVKTGQLANLDGSDRGYQAVSGDGRKVENPKQLYDTGNSEMAVGSRTYYAAYLNDTRKGLQDVEDEVSDDIQELISGLYHNAFKTAANKGDPTNLSQLKSTPPIKSEIFELPSKYKWLRTYALSGKI